MPLAVFQPYKTEVKSILITGGTGFIGKRLVQVLLSLEHNVTVLTRDIERASKHFKNTHVKLISDLVEITDNKVFDVIINLAGESLASGRWNKKRKENFINSRVDMTKKVVGLIARLSHKPDVLINGSAIGYYGSNDNESLNENSLPNDCFSHQLCKQWEEEALKADTRVCLLRIGIVLAEDGGSLAELELPYKFGFSMQIGAGKQWMSWIHRDDLIAMMLHAINDKNISGAINGTAPNPVTNKMFADALSLHHKTFLRLRFPNKVISLLVGELADEVLIAGQKVIPEKMLNAKFSFTYSDLNSALNAIIST